MKRLLSAIAKMVGINPGELNSAIEEIEKGNSEPFKEKMAQRKAQKIADEIWDFCYALFYGMKTWTEQEPQQL